MLQKKLGGADFNGKNNIQHIVQIFLNNKSNPHKQLYAPGAPFFKNCSRGKIKSQS